MRLTHINITMPKAGEDQARKFYGTLLGLSEIPKPEALRARGGVWFDAGGLDIHISVEENRLGADRSAVILAWNAKMFRKSGQGWNQPASAPTTAGPRFVAAVLRARSLRQSDRNPRHRRPQVITAAFHPGHPFSRQNKGEAYIYLAAGFLNGRPRIRNADCKFNRLAVSLCQTGSP